MLSDLTPVLAEGARLPVIRVMPNAIALGIWG